MTTGRTRKIRPGGTTKETLRGTSEKTIRTEVGAAEGVYYNCKRNKSYGGWGGGKKRDPLQCSLDFGKNKRSSASTARKRMGTMERVSTECCELRTLQHGIKPLEQGSTARRNTIEIPIKFTAGRHRKGRPGGKSGREGTKQENNTG